MVDRFQAVVLSHVVLAKALGYPLDEAESFGFNRATFYVVAKRRFKGGTGCEHPGEQHILRESLVRSTTNWSGAKKVTLLQHAIEPGYFSLFETILFPDLIY